MRLDERGRDVPVRKTERLHQNLPLSAPDRVHDQRIGSVAGSERECDFPRCQEILS